MFEAGNTQTLARHALDRAREALDSYFTAIAPLSRCAEDIPSAAFELSTSAHPETTQYIFDGRILESTVCPSHGRILLRFLLRETIKLALFKMLALGWRIRHGRHASETRRWASALMVGFANFRDGRLMLQDYAGFVETEMAIARRVSLALRLPQISVCAFFYGCSAEIQPVYAFMRWSDLISGWRAIRRQLRAIRSEPRLAGTRVEALALQDVASGHFMHGWLIARAIKRCATQDISPAAPVIFPMERHDWELLSMCWLQAAKRRVWAVQNCTFSPNDLNMYAGLAAAPAYRNTLPDRLYVLAGRWSSVFEALGLTVPLRVLQRHRFSSQCFSLDLRAGVSKLLYLGSINRRKVAQDLAILAQFSGIEVELRLHPSMTDLPEAAGFARAGTLDACYGAAVYADTTMVFQLHTDRSRLLFLDHPAFPNQDPACFFTDWPGKTIDCADPKQAIVSITRVLERSGDGTCHG